MPDPRSHVVAQNYEVRPYGNQKIEIWGAVVEGSPRVAATIDNFLFPTVAMSSADARKFAAAIIDAADRAERAAAGITAKVKS